MGQAKIASVSAKPSKAGVLIEIKGQNLARPTEFRRDGGSLYLLEFKAALTGKPSKLALHSGGVSYIKYGPYELDEKRSRIRIALKPTQKPVLWKSGSSWLVRISPLTATVPTSPVRAANTGTALVTQGVKASATGLTAAKKPTKAAAAGAKPATPAKPGTGVKLESRMPISLSLLAPGLNVSAPSTLTWPVKALAKNTPLAVMPGTSQQPQKKRAAKPAKPQTDAEAMAAALRTLGVKPDSQVLASISSTPATRAATKTDGNSLRARVERPVSIDVVNTDVLQVLKALAMQANVNIITAPDVSPADKPVRVTLTLNRVSLDNALLFVTAMTRTKYGVVGNTFVVTPAATFTEAMRQIADRDTGSYATRVVTLRSGEGEQIKAAALKALPAEGRAGWYEIIVQSSLQPGTTELPARQSPPPAADGPKASPDDNQPDDQEKAPVAKPRTRSYYLMLVGDPGRLDQVERYIRDLDMSIAGSFTMAGQDDIGTVVVPIFSGQPDRIRTMLQRLIAGNPRAEEFSISQTGLKELAEGEESTQVLLIMGPKSEVMNLQRVAATLDEDMAKAAGISLSRQDSLERIYEVVSLSYIEPKLAEFDLKSRVRGLYVTVLPEVVDPLLKGESENKKLDTPQDTPQAGNGQSAPMQQDLANEKKSIGGEPMKLMLRGTRDQIARAKAYLALVDIAPKQVALELRVLDLSKEDAIRAGIDWNLFTGGAVKVLRLNNSQPSAGNRVTVGFDGRDVTATLDKIANKNNLIARPNAIAMDGRSTLLFVGDTIRYIQSIQSTQNGVSVTTGSVQVGVTLEVRPRIGSNGSITMNLSPKVSFLRGFTDVPGGGQLPQTSDRSVSSTINILDGETIAIGGLIQDQDTREVSGVPILMDIPIIGQLFRKTSNTRKRTEVVMFLTARMIDGSATAGNVHLPQGTLPAPEGGRP